MPKVNEEQNLDVPRVETKPSPELKAGQTVREALDGKREQRKGEVTELVLCKFELFYCPTSATGLPDDSVYPVTVKQAQEEAAFFGVPFSEQ